MKKTVGEIAELVGGTVEGDSSLVIVGVNGIKQAGPQELTFLGSKKYAPYLETTRAQALLIDSSTPVSGKTLIRVAHPYMAFLKVIQAHSLEMERVHPPVGVHETAVLGRNVTLGENVAIDAHVRIADNAVIGDNAVLYAGVYVGHACEIGPDSVLYPNVVLREYTVVGARCILHAGAVLGSDGFGFAPMDGVLFKVPQVGTVVIGDDVEIGTNSAIDRATFGKTVIGRGSKIDNLVQIGHNVEMGEHCIVCGMAGIAGSVTIGDRVTIAAGAGLADHAVVGEKATVAGRAGVISEVKPGKTVSGFPAREHQETMRAWAALGSLPETLRRVRKLEQRIQELEDQLHGQSENDSR